MTSNTGTTTNNNNNKKSSSFAYNYRHFNKHLASTTGTRQCQRCLQTSHWTYECKNEQVYKYRPTRSKIIRKQEKSRSINDHHGKEEDEELMKVGDEESGEGLATEILKKRERKREQSDSNDSDSDS